MIIAVRSTLTAGIAASLVAAGAVMTAPTHTLPLTAVSSRAFQLSAAIAPLLQPVVPAPAASASTGTHVSANAASGGDLIINAYNFLQPWVQYGVNLAAWAVSWLPWPIGLIGPQANILYSGWQPIGQALDYSAAYLLGGQFGLIVPTLTNGVKTGINNLVQGEIQWVLSFFPPLPPLSFPVFPGVAAALAPRVAAAKAAATATTDPATTGTTAADVVADPAPVTMPAPRVRRSAHPSTAPAPAPAAAASADAPEASSAAPADAASSPDSTPAPKARPAKESVRAARAAKAKVGAASSTKTRRAAS